MHVDVSAPRYMGAKHSLLIVQRYRPATYRAHCNKTLDVHRPTNYDDRLFTYLFRDLLSRSYVYNCVWSVITANSFTPAKRDESFSAMFTEL